MNEFGGESRYTQPLPEGALGSVIRGLPEFHPSGCLDGSWPARVTPPDVVLFGETNGYVTREPWVG